MFLYIILIAVVVGMIIVNIIALTKKSTVKKEKLIIDMNFSSEDAAKAYNYISMQQLTRITQIQTARKLGEMIMMTFNCAMAMALEQGDKLVPFVRYIINDKSKWQDLKRLLLNTKQLKVFIISL